MKTKNITDLIGLPGLFLAFALAPLAMFAQGTAFTYQGRLTAGGQAANGIYDFRFSIFDSAEGGTPLASPITTNAVGVSNGLFTVTLDFGVGIFGGESRWLAIEVRTNGGSAFSPLAGRQSVTPSPYAIHAANAGTAATALAANTAGIASSVVPGAVTALGAPGGITNAVQVGTNGLVGIGTGTNPPAAGLQITTGTTIYQPNLQFQVKDETGVFTNLAGAWGVAVSSNLLAVSAQSDSAITLMDISTPSSPIVRSQLKNGVGAFTNLAGASGVAFNGNVLAVAAMDDSAVTLVSVTNPANPVKLVELRDGVGGFNELGGAFDVAFSTNNLLAIAGYFDHAVTLVDVSNPSAPVKRVAMTHGSFGFTNLLNPSQVAFSGNLLAIAAYVSGAVTLVDVSDPANPVKRAELRDGVDGFNYLVGVLGVAFSGNLLAVVSWNEHAVTLVDVSNPSSPVLRAVLQDGVNGYNFIGWPRRVAFFGQLLAISSFEDAITLVDVSNPAAPVLKGVFPNYQAGFSYLRAPAGLAWSGSTLAVAGNLGSLTLLRPSAVEVNLAAQDYVGIGTTLPEAPLHVVGNVIVEGADRVELRAMRVSMGHNTTAGNSYATAMGNGTVASGYSSTAMGWMTTASGDAATAMGENTTASGDCSVAMGYSSAATNRYAFAAGRQARANHQGAFVWADSTAADFASTAADQFLIRATGGVGINTNNPQSALHVAGTVTATAFAGSGAGLTSLSGAALASGSVSNVALATGAVTSDKVADGTLTAADLSPTLASNTFWRLDGNTGTTPATHFLGTTDNQPLELRVNGQRVLRLEPKSGGSPNVISGSPGNHVAPGIVGATISGGGSLSYLGFAYTNVVAGNYATIGGGVGNVIRADAAWSTIGGGAGNIIESNSYASTIAGGSGNMILRGSRNATIGGGDSNLVGFNSTNAFIGGGQDNTIVADSWHATIAGGSSNLIGSNSFSAVIAGGLNNSIGVNADYSVIGGGSANTIATNAACATIPGGSGNFATNYAFAAGYRAKANHTGAFVWADAVGADFTSTTNHEFAVRATGGVRFATGYLLVTGSGNEQAYLGGDGLGGDIEIGSRSGSITNVGFWNSALGQHMNLYARTFNPISDRAAKENFTPVNPLVVLEKVAALPLAEWNFKGETGIKHLGPVAQDFYAAFGLGTGDKSIATVDADGVALAAIQGLNQKLEAHARGLEAENQALRERVARLEKLVQQLLNSQGDSQ